MYSFCTTQVIDFSKIYSRTGPNVVLQSGQPPSSQRFPEKRTFWDPRWLIELCESCRRWFSDIVAVVAIAAYLDRAFLLLGRPHTYGSVLFPAPYPFPI
jgi:hypothetical protein